MLKQAFEHVRRTSVLREAKLQDYPLVPLMASLTSYAWPRHIGLGGLTSKLIRATRGIAACSVFATFELRCLLRRAIHSLQFEVPRSAICIHVDDLCLISVEYIVDEGLNEANGLVGSAVE